MTTAGTAADGGEAPGQQPIQILAGRLAASLNRREPGYPLPRRTALARRFQVAPAQIDAAVEMLVRRRLLRRLPTGEVRRAGPAQMLLRLDGLPGLSSLIDPMDHQLSCTAARTSRLRAPADIADGLRLAPGGQVCVRRCLWAADGEPAAVVTTYVPDDYCHLLTGPLALPGKGNLAGPSPLASALDGGMSPGAVPGLTLHPGAVRIELQAPGASAARRLRLATGAPAVLVTARLDRAAGIWGDARADAPGRAPHASPRPNPDAGPAPVALTVLVLRPDVFRIVLHT